MLHPSRAHVGSTKVRNFTHQISDRKTNLLRLVSPPLPPSLNPAPRPASAQTARGKVLLNEGPCLLRSMHASTSSWAFLSGRTVHLRAALGQTSGSKGPRMFHAKSQATLTQKQLWDYRKVTCSTHQKIWAIADLTFQCRITLLALGILDAHVFSDPNPQRFTYFQKQLSPSLRL